MPTFSELMFGGDPEKVELPQELEEARQRRARLLEATEREALGEGPTEGQQAILEAGRAAADEASQRALNRGGAGRGFARLAAQSQAQRLAPQVRQKTLGSSILAAGQQRAADVSRARGSLAALTREEELAALRDDELRRQRASPGLFPVLATGAGAGLGYLAGGAPGAKVGAQYGGLAGTAISSQYGV